MKQHKVGTITLGAMLILFGGMFLMRLFFPQLSYEIIFRLWPITFISLGIEILLSNFHQTQDRLVYDKTAFALIIILSFFAMGMAIADISLQYANEHVILNI
ncbi:MAG TPA: DUF5668 domain-containing protein [Mobilitalea sp.]|nr:DUF5668 domain-containing protein [Mobilitalea sp.]